MIWYHHDKNRGFYALQDFVEFRSNTCTVAIDKLNNVNLEATDELKDTNTVIFKQS